MLKNRPQTRQAGRRSSARHLGRLRLSTLGLVIAFVALFWVYENYSAPLQAPAPAEQVVPPGYIPDPDYTWVPRTNVRTRELQPTTTTTTTTTVTTTTSPTSPAESTSPDGTPMPAGPQESTPAGPSTTVIDPDGSGPLNPQTFTQSPPATSTPSTPAGSAPPTTLAPR
ncbi:hypothetical protein JDV09_10010 [Mycobacterium sp. Y57]|nr:hypothetical protein [Mycolicibacterium xanthum]MBX7432434.1 hypothetical protein [Mycolicibacterium xanthum]